MRNKIDFTSPPDVLFLNPWQDPGVRLLGEPDFVWRGVPQGTIKGFAVSVHAQINAKISHFVRATETARTFLQAIEYQTVPVILESASFRKSFVLVDDRLFLTGAAGIRALNQFRWENEGSEIAPDDLLEDYFQTCRQTNIGAELPIYMRARWIKISILPFLAETPSIFIILLASP